MIKKILILVFLMIITVGCNSNKQNNVKKFTSSEISLRGSGDYGGPYSVKFTVLLTKYENIVYTKGEMNFGKYDHLETMKMDNDFFEELYLETYYYDKNGIDLDDGDVLFNDDFDIVNNKRNEDIIVEGQTYTHYDDDELFVFDNVEYIIIEYKDRNGESRKTKKIKRSFLN
tara:strand:+ start:64 stop:579 length:516 start_codon:yes stop_codon:yes gene_type:complete